MRWLTMPALIAGLVLTSAAPAAAGTVTTPNACLWSFDGYWRNQPLDFAGAAAPNPVAPGSGLALTSATIHARLPDWVGQIGANFGLLKEGDNEIPTKVWVALAGDSTPQSVQVVPLETVARTTVTKQPDGSYTATPIDVTVPIPDTAWTAPQSGAAGFRQAGPGTLPEVPGGRNGAAVTPKGSVFISSTFANGSGIQLDCQPGSAPEDGLSFTAAPSAPFETAPVQVGAPTLPAPALKPQLTVRSTALRAKGSRVTLALTCAGAPCGGTVTVKAGTLTVARRLTYKLRAGERKTVRLTLSAKARKRLKSRAFNVKVTVTSTGGATVSKRLKLR